MSKKPSHQRSRAQIGLRFFLTCTAIVVVAVGIVALGVTRPAPQEPAVTTASLGNPLPLTPGVPIPGGGSATPKPWQYDPVTNKHWDPRPGHQHWHPGLPPANPEPTSPTATTLPTPTPQPWEYDAVNDRYWHAEHNHYHPGQPPPPDQR